MITWRRVSSRQYTLLENEGSSWGDCSIFKIQLRVVITIWPSPKWLEELTDDQWHQWVIKWSVIDYWWWSIGNRWLKFCGLSISHRWHRLLIDVINYSLMLLNAHWLPIKYPSITHWFHIYYYAADIMKKVRGETRLPLVSKCTLSISSARLK